MAAHGKMLTVLSAVVFMASAHAQKTYECKDSVTGSIYQRYEPCPPGSDVRATPEQQRSQQKAATEEARQRQNTQNDYASLRGEVRVGMTREQVQRAWGYPGHVGTKITEVSTNEWWSYACAYSRHGYPIRHAYVYFRNDRVTSINRDC